MPTPLLRVDGIDKRFGRKGVLEGESLDVFAGEAVALVVALALAALIGVAVGSPRRRSPHASSRGRSRSSAASAST